jgi:type IV pilus assembly protein PilW
MKVKANSGFTLVELLVAIALAVVIMAGLYRTFRTQHDTYIVQDQVAATQQNLRAAMYLITRDLQMAGWYTNFDSDNHTIDLGNDLGERTGRPLFFPEDNSPGGDDGTIRQDTDVLVIMKAADTTIYRLEQGETVSGGSIGSTLAAKSGLNPAVPDPPGHEPKKYGLLVKNDLRTAEFFVLNPAYQFENSLTENYVGDDAPEKADILVRMDIIIYKIEEEDGRPMLKRRNLGNDNGYQTVAENIDNMQIMYHLQNDSVPKHGNEINSSNQARIRAVEVILVGRTAHLQRRYVDTKTYDFANNTGANLNPNDNYRRKVLSTIVKTRNVGL